MKSTVVGLTHACASFQSIKHGYLSLQKYSLFGRIFGESSTISISHVAKLVTNRVSLLNRKRHASPQTHLLVALLLQMRWLGSQARGLLVCIITQIEKKNHTFWYGSFF